MAIWRRFFVAWLLALACTQALAAPRTAVVLALDGAIGPGSASYVVRGLKAAQRQNAVVVVLRMDTPGGLDSAMRDVIRADFWPRRCRCLPTWRPAGRVPPAHDAFILYAAALAIILQWRRAPIWALRRRFLLFAHDAAGRIRHAKPADDGGEAESARQGRGPAALS